MEPSDTEQTFLRDLVKTARQKPHHVVWTDRDGTERHTTLTPAEVVRLNTIAAGQKISKSELLRRAAHVPVTKERPPSSGSASGVATTLANPDPTGSSASADS